MISSRHVRRMLPVALAAALLTSQADVARAQYPEKPIRLIVGFAAGGGTDIIARVVSEKLGPILGQPVIVENKPGAGGLIGIGLVAKSSPDGYTLLLANNPPFSTSPGVEPPPPFDPIKDFAPIALICSQENFLTVHHSIPAKTLGEFIAYAKANPGKINFASPGVGTPHHLGTEFLRQLAGIDLVHVAYRGVNPAMPDVLSGQVPVFFTSYRSVISHVTAGTLRMLAVGAPTRSRYLPDLPTMAELGYPLDNTAWFGVVAPAATPRLVIDKMSAAIDKVLAMPDVSERFTTMGLETLRATPDELAHRIRAEVAQWLPIIKKARIRIE